MKNIFRIFRADLKGLLTNFFALVIAVGLCALPALYAWFNIYANWDPYANTGNIRIAVASLDKGWTKDDGETLNMGQNVIDSLKEQTSIGWRFVDTEKEALDGVYSGKYYAAVVIDDDFTYSMYNAPADNFTNPKITYYENQKKNAVASKITDTAVSTLQTSINEQFIKAVAETVFQTTNGLSEELSSDDAVDTMIEKLSSVNENLKSYSSMIDSFMAGNVAISDTTGDANKTLSDGQEMIGDGVKKLEEGKNGLNSTQASFQTFSTNIQNSMTQIENSMNAISDEISQASLNDNAETLTSDMKNIADNAKSLVEELTGLQDGLNKTNVKNDLNQAKQDVQDKLDDAGKDAQNKIDDAKQDAKDQIDDANQNLQDKIDDANKNLQDKIDDANKNLQDKIDDANQNIQDQLDPDIKEDIDQAKQDVQDKVDEVNGNIQDKVDDVNGNIQNRVDEANGEIQSKLDDANQNLQNKIDDTKQDVQDKIDEISQNSNHEAIDTEIASIKAKIEEIEKQAREAAENNVAGTVEDGVNKGVDAVKNSLSSYSDTVNQVKNLYQNRVVPQVNDMVSNMSDTLTNVESLLNNLSGTMDGMKNIFDGVDTTLGTLNTSMGQLQTVLGNTSGKIQEVLDRLEGASKSEQMEILMQLLAGDPDTYSEFFSQPVAVEDHYIYEIENYGSGVAPFYSTLAIWVGVTLLVSLFKVHADKDGLVNAKPHELFLGRYLLFFLLSQIQTLIIVLGDLYLLKIQCISPFAFWAASAVASFAFSMLIFALTIAFGDIGKALAVVIMVIQIAGSGGTYPIEALPTFFKAVYIFFPFPYAINAMRECIGGMYQNTYSLCLLELMIFAAAGLLIGLVIRIPFIRVNHYIEKRMEDTKML